MKIIAYNHTHWDREWYKTFQEFRLRFVEVMDLIIQEIQSENIDCFYLDGQTVILEDYFEIYPENKAFIRDLISRNKIIIGPWYVLADEFLVSGESLFRNMLIGIKQAEDLGCNKFIGYLPDSFGHNSEIPRILSAFNIKNAVFWRGAGGQKSEFIWISEDNSSVIATYLIEGYFQNILHENISINEKAEKLRNLLDKIKEYSTTDYILLPIGGDHLGAVINFKKQIQEITKILKNYSFETGGIFEYIEKINRFFHHQDDNNSKLTLFTGELRDNSKNPILQGALSTRLYLKQKNAFTSWKLSKFAEPFHTFLQANKFIPSRKNELQYAWKLLLKNHPHDSICGCSIDEVHDEMMSRFEQVNQISDGLISRGQNAISQKINKDSIWVYNTSDYEFTGVIKIKTNKKLPKNLESQFLKSTQEFPSEILLDTQRPPFSEDIEEFREYLVYVENIKPYSINIIDKDFKYSKSLDNMEVCDNFIKNDKIKIEINPDGTLKLTDLELNKSFDGLHYFYNRADIGDTYNYAPLENDIPLKSKFLKSEVLENGKLRSILRLYYELNIPEYFDENINSRSKETNKTVITTDIFLKAGSKQAEFITGWENKSKDHILQIKFAFREKITETLAENTFGMIKRKFDPDYSLKEFMPAAKGSELKTNTAPMQRFVWTQGLGIITKGLCEYGVSGNELYITILRSVGKLSKLSLNTRNFPAGPPLDTLGAQCLFKHTVNYAICATENPVELFKESDEFFGNIIADVGNNIPETHKNLPFTAIKINNKNIYTYAVKIPEKGNGVILRLMNLSCKAQNATIETDLDFSCFTQTDGLETQISKPFNIHLGIEFKPYELKTILIS